MFVPGMLGTTGDAGPVGVEGIDGVPGAPGTAICAPGATNTAGPPASAPNAHELNANIMSAAAKNFAVLVLKIITPKKYVLSLC